jgi:hypothetical protein
VRYSRQIVSRAFGLTKQRFEIASDPQRREEHAVQIHQIVVRDVVDHISGGFEALAVFEVAVDDGHDRGLAHDKAHELHGLLALGQILIRMLSLCGTGDAHSVQCAIDEDLYVAAQDIGHLAIDDELRQIRVAHLDLFAARQW